MSHDKFCDLHDACIIEIDDVETETEHTDDKWCKRCNHLCLCDYIAKIRRDERATATP